MGNKKFSPAINFGEKSNAHFGDFTHPPFSQAGFNKIPLHHLIIILSTNHEGDPIFLNFYTPKFTTFFIKKPQTFSMGLYECNSVLINLDLDSYCSLIQCYRSLIYYTQGGGRNRVDYEKYWRYREMHVDRGGLWTLLAAGGLRHFSMHDNWKIMGIYENFSGFTPLVINKRSLTYMYGYVYNNRLQMGFEGPSRLVCICL